MIGVNRIERLIGASVGLLSLASLAAFIELPAKAQLPTCYMITQTGELINLSSICGVEQNPNNISQNNQNPQTTTNGQYLTNQQTNQQTLTGQQPVNQQQNLAGQVTTIAAPSGAATSTQGATTFNSGLGAVTDSAEIRSEPSGGSLVQQLQGGEQVRVIPRTQTNNSVLVETNDGRRGWMNIWNLPGSSGATP